MHADHFDAANVEHMGFWALHIKTGHIKTAFSENSRVSLFLPALNPDPPFSPLLINNLCSIFFQNGELCVLKISSGR